MSDTVIKLENIGKQYRLGTVGSGTLRGDLQRWWYRMRGKEDPALKIGETNKLDSVEGEYVWALRDINLEVKQGEVLGIIGKNGAGKSTLLKLLSRVTGPTTGQIKVKGRIASLLEVGTGFHPELTGRENIFLNGAILGMTKAEIRSKFDEIVDFAGVAKYIDTPVKRYSSGMYVRLAFAVAAHLEPDILVVDEVLAVGDAEFQKKAIGKMQEVSKGGGRTVLFVSHNMVSVQALCTKGVVLSNGQIEFGGDITKTIDYYVQQTTKLQNKKIEDREDRMGNNKLKVTNIRFLHKETKEELEFIQTGMPILIEIKYKLQKNVNIKNIYLSINFSHLRGQEAFVCNNRFNGDELKDINSNGVFLCEIKKWPLIAGKYIYRIHCEGDNELLDRVTNAGQVIVHDGDFYGTGVKIPAHLNGVLIDYKWKKSL